MALIAMHGSAAHADQYCKMRANMYAKSVEGAGGTSVNNGFIINNLIPRPEPVAMPTRGGAAVENPHESLERVLDPCFQCRFVCYTCDACKVSGALMSDTLIRHVKRDPVQNGTRSDRATCYPSFV